MNGRTSTILTALVVAALIAVGVAYLIANPASREDNQEPTPTSSPILTGAPVALQPSLTPAQNNVVQTPGRVEGVDTETSAPTGSAEWVLVGLLAIISLSGWNLVRLQRGA